MNASHLFAGIYWPVMLMVLATGGFSPPGVVPTARAAQIHAAAAPLRIRCSRAMNLSTRMRKAQHPIRRPSASAVSSVPMRQQTSVAVASLRSRTSAVRWCRNVLRLGHRQPSDPGLPGEDAGFQSSFTGTYAVNADGTGTTTTKFTLPGGATRETSSQFVITKAEVRSGQRGSNRNPLRCR